MNDLQVQYAVLLAEDFTVKEMSVVNLRPGIILYLFHSYFCSQASPRLGKITSHLKTTFLFLNSFAGPPVSYVNYCTGASLDGSFLMPRHFRKLC